MSWQTYLVTIQIKVGGNTWAEAQAAAEGPLRAALEFGQYDDYTVQSVASEPPDVRYFIRSKDGYYLTDHGSWSAKPEQRGRFSADEVLKEWPEALKWSPSAMVYLNTEEPR
jgi:hypothetical protein